MALSLKRLMLLQCFHRRQRLLVLALFINIVIMVYLAFLQDRLGVARPRQASAMCPGNVSRTNYTTRPGAAITGPAAIAGPGPGQHPTYFPQSVTFLIRQFEDFENSLATVVKALLERFDFEEGHHQVVVVADSLPYPPLNLPVSPHVRLVSLLTSPEGSYSQFRPEHFIITQYVLFLPDNVAFLEAGALSYMLDYHSERSAADDVRLSAWHVDSRQGLQCLGLRVTLRQWSLLYSLAEQGRPCDAIHGPSLVLIAAADLLQLPEPFKRPLDEALFIQTALRGWRVSLDARVLTRWAVARGDDPHKQWKRRVLREARLGELYAHFGIKLVQKADAQEEWHGCGKGTGRCFGSLVNDTPEYLYRGRWTPPCCLRALRVTARHVLRLLESQGVRYWLEGGSLLGAARHADLIPWDYDVDVGVYQEDVAKCYQLMACRDGGSYEDEDGFVWEKAREGDFYRVQYSQTNHLHVDIFPFYPTDNGTMTKDTWMRTHPQDRPFPERYLKPLTKIDFVGMKASAPNNWREFLELKFGQGAIEDGKYPDSKKLPPMLP